MKKFLPLVLCFLLTKGSFATIHYSYSIDYISTSSHYYDLDMDGTNDFLFYRDANDTVTYVQCLKASSMFAADSNNAAKGYTMGAGIGTDHWQYGTGVLANGSSGLFANGNKYLLVQFQNAGGSTFYGWFYITNNGSDVQGYAWNDVVGQTLTAGQGQVSGIADLSAVAPPVVSLSTGYISFNDCTAFDKAVVYSVDGKELAAIDNPVALQQYSVGQYKGILVIAFYSKEQLLVAGKYWAH